MTETLVRRRCGAELEEWELSSATGRKKPDEAPAASKPRSDRDDILCIVDGYTGM
jgi:hypothetical protein